MIDEGKLKSKIEGLKSNLIHGACSSQIAMETRCKEEAYNEVLAILDSMQEEPIILIEEILKKNGFLLNPRPRYNPPYWSKLFTASDGREYLCKINMEQKIRETLMTVLPLASDEPSQPTCYLPHPKTIQQLEKSLRLFNIKYVIKV